MKALFLLLVSLSLEAQGLECHWVCENPQFPKVCQVNCINNCSTAECDERNCFCNSFLTEVDHCTPPNTSPTVCSIHQSGKGCINNDRLCACNLSCETECQWDCQVPVKYQEPNCHRVCEEPSCVIDDHLSISSALIPSE